MNKILPFMVLNGEQKYITENYVSVPPALTITDEAGSIWTLGFQTGEAPKGEYAFDVLCNGIPTGYYASRIERRKNQIWLFTKEGWKRLKTVRKEITQVFGIGARISEKCDDPVIISIYGPGHRKLIHYVFNPQTPDIYNLANRPIVCLIGQWLYAKIEPTRVSPFVTVMAYIGDSNMREVPILGGVIE